MQCQQANELFSDHVERALDAAQTVRLENHLSACAACRDDVAGLRRIMEQISRMPQVEPPASLHAAITSGLDRQQERDLPPAKRAGIAPSFNMRALAGPRAFAYAAALLVLALGSLEVVHSQRAAIDPLGGLLRLLHPASADAGDTMPVVTATRSEWVSGANGGTLLVHLKAAAPNDTALPALNYHAELTRGDAKTLAAHAPSALASVLGHFDATGNATISLPAVSGQDMNAPDMALVVTLSLPERSGAATQRIVIPLKSDAGSPASNGK